MHPVVCVCGQWRRLTGVITLSLALTDIIIKKPWAHKERMDDVSMIHSTSRTEQQKLDAVESAVSAVWRLDLVVLTMWSACAIAILATHCLELALSQIASIIHFGVQTTVLAAILFDELPRLRSSGTEGGGVNVSTAWIVATIIVLLGDVFLISYDTLLFSHVNDTVCRQVSIAQLAVDSGNCLVGLLSIICYVYAVKYVGVAVGRGVGSYGQHQQLHSVPNF